MRNRIRHAFRAFAAAGIFSGNGETAALKPQSHLRTVNGLILQVDPIAREIQVLINDVPMNFYVPLNSNVLMNDERVKLRLLQPRDHAGLVYSIEDGVAVAHAVVIHWPPVSD